MDVDDVYVRERRSNDLHVVSFNEGFDLLVHVWRLCETAYHKDILHMSERLLIRMAQCDSEGAVHTLSSRAPLLRACCICPSSSSYVRQSEKPNISFMSSLVVLVMRGNDVGVH